MDNFKKYTFKYEDFEFVKRYMDRNKMTYHIEDRDTLLVEKKYEDLLKEIVQGRIYIS